MLPTRHAIARKTSSKRLGAARVNKVLRPSEQIEIREDEFDEPPCEEPEEV